MKTCPVCKTENEEEYCFCKNCGRELYRPAPPKPTIGSSPFFKPQAVPERPTPVQPVPQYSQKSKLVPVYMKLPDPRDPSVLSLQTVYVTPEQYEAIRQAGEKK